ncbi:MAG: hypothetical protein M1826_001151 [Phylliscum demangeonii]|nr:MAG: hypothetical protein M1826_001151 [Phylliscum demangeonii]
MADIPPPPSEEPVAPSFVKGSQIVLQVGERRFVTTRGTLTGGSGYFEGLLSGCWGDEQPDGSYFIDADPVLFDHILRYLRRGVLPVFYDRSKGFDHALYTLLLEEAKYFQIPRLEKWIADKMYIQVVKVSYTAEELAGAMSHSVTLPADVEVEYHPAWKNTKVYICPRGIPVHRGRPEACGKLCKTVQGDASVEYEEVLELQMMVVRRCTIVDRDSCVEDRCE